jgi:hypothetical protein
MWAGACGVINKAYIVQISGVKGKGLGVDEVFYAGFLKMSQEHLSHSARNGEPMAMPLSGWCIWSWNEK